MTLLFRGTWTIALTNGIIRNIFPQAVPKDNNVAIYKARFQAGFISNGSSSAYPVTITWDKSDVPSRTDVTKNPSGASWWIADNTSNGQFFKYNMNTGIGRNSATIIDYSAVGTKSTIRVNKDDIDGFIITYDFTSGVEEQPVAGMPISFELSEVSPNPFSNSTSTIIGVPTASMVNVDVYDAMGVKVATLANNYYNSGRYELTWNAKSDNGADLSSGVYFVKMTAGAFSTTQRLMLVK